MTDDAATVPLTPTGRKYTRYLLSFVVTLGCGLAPILGQVKVPGFVAIASVFPRNMQEGVLPFAALLLILPAIGVQFFLRDTITERRLNRLFAVTFFALFACVLILYNVYSRVIVTVNYEGARETAAYIVGSSMVTECPCLKSHLQITTCIGHAITLNPAEVSACYPMEEINGRRSLLSTIYLLTMFSLGALIGLLMLKESAIGRRPRPT